jgi:hypothetical protein
LFAQSAHNEQLGLRGVDESAAAGNTFFSGRRLNDRSELSNQYNAAKSGYISNYRNNYDSLMGQMGAARGNYEQSLRDADRGDLDAWLSMTPQPTGPGSPAKGVSRPNPAQQAAASAQARARAEHDRAMALARLRRRR